MPATKTRAARRPKKRPGRAAAPPPGPPPDVASAPSSPRGPHALSCYVDEDWEVVVTIEGTGSIAGWEFRFTVWNRNNQIVKDGTTTPDVEVVDPDARQVAGRFAPTVAGEYRWFMRRTNPGTRAVSSYGTLRVNPVPQPL